jgi:hypothetical protein
MLQKCFIQALPVLPTFKKRSSSVLKGCDCMCFQEEIRPPPKKDILENSRRDVLSFQKGHFQVFQEGICSLSKKGNFKKRCAISTKKTSFRKFKKRYAHSSKRVIPFTKFKKAYTLSPKGLFQEIQGGIFSKKGYSREFKKGCAPLNKKTSSWEFKRGCAPPSKRAIPGNSRMYSFPL